MAAPGHSDLASVPLVEMREIVAAQQAQINALAAKVDALVAKTARPMFFMCSRCKFVLPVDVASRSGDVVSIHTSCKKCLGEWD